MTTLLGWFGLRVLMLVREQATGGRCSVHVLRRWPSAASSPFTSLHSAPQRPVRSMRGLTAAASCWKEQFARGRLAISFLAKLRRTEARGVG